MTWLQIEPLAPRSALGRSNNHRSPAAGNLILASLLGFPSLIY